MRIAVAVALLGIGLSTTGCKEKTPELDPNSQGGPIASTHPVDGPLTTNPPSELSGTVRSGNSNPLGSVPGSCPSSTGSAEPLPLPAGLSVTARLEEAVSSHHERGHRFAATVTMPVIANGSAVIPAGASTLGTVTTATVPETLLAKQVLGLRLNVVCFGGRAYSFQADELISASTEAGGRSISGTSTGPLPVGPASAGEDDIVLPPESILTFSTAATRLVKLQGASRLQRPQ